MNQQSIYNKFSVVVCTYNRGALLQECLLSLLKQDYPLSEYEIWVVDNNSTDNTAALVEALIQTHSNIFYYKEQSQGLGYARNAGYHMAKYKWVAYVDDDAKAHVNYLKRANEVINTYSFDCFGGVYNAWYTERKPKWISDNFGTNRDTQNFTGNLEQGFMSGGNMIWKKSVLEQLHGFPVDIGMVGNKISYGEETLIQVHAKEKGFQIGFDPLLQIDHYVQPYKLKYTWHIKSSYAVGLDFWSTFNKTPNKKDASFKNYGYLIKRLFGNIRRNGAQLLTKSNYYWENFVLDTLQPFALDHGKIKSARKLFKSQN